MTPRTRCREVEGTPRPAGKGEKEKLMAKKSDGKLTGRFRLVRNYQTDYSIELWSEKNKEWYWGADFCAKEWHCRSDIRLAVHDEPVEVEIWVRPVKKTPKRSLARR